MNIAFMKKIYYKSDFSPFQMKIQLIKIKTGLSCISTGAISCDGKWPLFIVSEFLMQGGGGVLSNNFEYKH